MTDSWKINKWKEDLTPKRAIKNFFLHATPVDSPDPDELVQLFPGSTNESHEDRTPVARSSQSSQLGSLKRKHEKSQQSEGNVSKKNLLDETEIFPDSVFDRTELPSRLESPSVGIPTRPSIKNKKRMSTTSYTEAIQSQQSQKSKKAEFEDYLDESSIPSGIGSPNEPISQRPGKSKGRVSMSVFTKSLAEKDVQEKIEDTASISAAGSSSLESAGIPSNLDSPEQIYSQRVGISNAKRRVSSTGYKDILDKSGSKRIQLETSISQERSSSEMSFPLESPDQIHSQRPVISKERKRVSSTGFRNVLNKIDSKQNQIESSASSTNSSLEESIASDAEDKPVENPSRRSKVSISSFSRKSEKVDLVTQGKPNESFQEITPKTSIVNLPARKSKSRISDRQDHGKDKTSEVSQQLSEVLSSGKSPEVLKKPVSDPRKSSITPANVTRSSLARSSRNESIIESTVTQSPGIPSTLGSPDQIPSQRPVISKERKRVSSTGFKNVLDKFNPKQNQFASSSSSENSSLENTSASDAEESPVRNPSRRSEATLPSDSRISEKADLVQKGKPNASLKEITPKTSPVNLPARKSKSRISDRQDHGKDKTLKVSQNSSEVASSENSVEVLETRSVSIQRKSSIAPVTRRPLTRSSSRIVPVIDPPATESVEETKFEARVLSHPVGNALVQYVLSSGNEEEEIADSSDKIVEVTTKADKSAAPVRTRTFTEDDVSDVPAANEVALSISSEVEKVEMKRLSIRLKRISSNSAAASTIPEFDSPDNAFSPIFSSTRLKKTGSVANEIIEEPMLNLEETRNATVNQLKQPLPLSPHEEKSIADSSTGSLSSDIPSKLDSPVEVKEYPRPGPVSSRKKVSMTGYLATVNQESIHLSSSEPESPKANLRETPKFRDSNNPVDPPMHNAHQRTPKLSAEELSKSSSKTPTSKVLVEEKGTGSHRTLTPVVKDLRRSLRRSQIPALKKELRKSSRTTPTLTQLDEKEDEFPRNSSQVSDKQIESSASTATLPPTESVRRNISKEPSGSLPSTTSVSSTETIVITNSSSSDTAVNRSEKPLKSVTLSGKNVSEEIVTPNEEPLPDTESEVEETPPSDYESGEERDDPATPGLSSESNRSSTKSVKITMSPTNRYPALKNSTVVAGGAPFLGTPLSMSPIRLSEKETPSTVPSTPTTPSLTRKPIRSVAQSPMFLNVMQKAIRKTVLKADSTHSDPPIHTSPSLPPLTPASSTPTSILPDASSGTKRKSLANPPPLIASSSTPASKTAASSTPTSSSVTKSKTFATSKNAVGAKKSILSNPGKGKSLALPMLDEMPDESSDTEWEDLERDLKVKPLAIKIAFEEIEDRSKDFGLPLEERLKNDPIFQAKVKSQRARLAAQKAEEEAVLAKNKLAQKKPRVVAKRKTPKAENIASEAINKANLRFYARTKVNKEALDSVHDLVGEWFDFTVDQMEMFCHDEGKSALETWEDCMKMLKRQKIVKNYADYSGLCHSLLLNDECAKLLPSEFPPRHYERKSDAKRQSK